MGVTRIVSGTAGGRTVEVPPSGTRPTTERVREALFSRLDHLGVVDGALVLDLYAGSGALGLEAASRGARRVVLVEHARNVARLIERNARTLGLDGAVSVVARRAETFVAGLADSGEGPFDLVFLDPPYEVTAPALDEVIAVLAADGVMAPGGVVVVERDRRSPAPSWPTGWVDEGARRYGDTTVYLAGPEVAA